jgi:hypothetical protein
MPLASARHDCPGQCGRRVVHSMLACGICWPRLPEDLRRNVVRADNIRRRRPEDTALIRAHRSAVVACLDWYRANTTETTHA